MTVAFLILMFLLVASAWLGVYGLIAAVELSSLPLAGWSAALLLLAAFLTWIAWDAVTA